MRDSQIILYAVQALDMVCMRRFEREELKGKNFIFCFIFRKNLKLPL